MIVSLLALTLAPALPIQNWQPGRESTATLSAMLSDRSLKADDRIQALEYLAYREEPLQYAQVEAMKYLASNGNAFQAYTRCLGLCGSAAVKDLKAIRRRRSVLPHAEATFALVKTIQDGEALGRQVLRSLSESPEAKVAALRGLEQRGSLFARVEALRRLANAQGPLLLECLAVLRRRPQLEDAPYLIDVIAEHTGRPQNEAVQLLQELTGYPVGANFKSWRFLYLKHKAEGTPFRSTQQTEIHQKGGTLAYMGIQLLGERVCFVMDGSGSMAQHLHYQKRVPKGQQAVDELTALLPQLPGTAAFNVVFFSDGISSLVSRNLLDKDEASVQRATSWLNKYAFQGGTNLYGGLRESFECEDVEEVVLLSDGEPTMGELLEPDWIRVRLAAWNRWRNVRVSAISFGAPPRARMFLAGLAQDHGGAYRTFE